MTQIDAPSTPDVPAGKSREWNFHPALPIAMSPVFDVPPKPSAAASWLLGTWLKLTPPVHHLIWAIVVYLFLWPPLSAMAAPGLGWVQGAVVIFGVVIAVASAWHLYLYVFAGQEMRLKFDVRPMEKSARFTFGSQVWDNIFWTLASSTVAMTFWVLLVFWCTANGWAPTLASISAAPVWFVAVFFVIRFWQSFHFYWIHRLIHRPLLFKHVHYLHHRNINVGPWSSLSMHSVESVLYFSGLLIHLVLPTHPIHIFYHMLALSLGAVISHSGFDKLLVQGREAIKAGSFHHQLHHRYFECNYGSEEIPLDRWFGSFHDGTPEATQHIRARKKKLFAKA